MLYYLALATALIQQLEQCRLAAYPDSVGRWTIGYGHTDGVKRGDTCTQDQADTWLRQDLAIADDRLSTAIFGATTVLTAHQRAALISFVFNVGTGYAPGKTPWTIWQDIRAGNLADVPTQLLRFVHGDVDGQEVVIDGLVNRRHAEIAFWNTADEEVQS